MQHISTIDVAIKTHRGGRVSSPQFRATQKLADEFAGLEEGTDHYALLLLVKRLGKHAGFTPRMIQLLDYYAAYTRKQDWDAGNPIVFQSLSRTSMDLGVSERQIQKLERQLFEAGAIIWRDSGNHKRYGQRDAKSGNLVFAFGVDLSPLAAMKATLERKLSEKKAYEQRWMELKRQISTYRSMIRGLLLERQEEGIDVSAEHECYAQIAVQIRSNMVVDRLELLVAAHRDLYKQLAASPPNITHELSTRTPPPPIAPKTREDSPKSEKKFVHNKYTRNRPFNKLNTVKPTSDRHRAGHFRHRRPTALPTTCTGIEHIQLRSAIVAASDEFKQYLPLGEPNWLDVVEAASRRSRQLGISQRNWAHACQQLGRSAAAVCVLITDQASQRPDDPVRQSPAYFRGLINRASRGELQLHKSIFRLRRRGNGKDGI